MLKWRKYFLPYSVLFSTNSPLNEVYSIYIKLVCPIFGVNFVQNRPIHFTRIEN